MLPRSLPFIYFSYTMLIIGGSFTYVYLMSTVAWLATVVLFFTARRMLRD